MKAAGTPRATSTRGRRVRRAAVSTAFGRLAGVTPDRAMPQHSLTVGGTQYDVDFPYAPYDCQLTMMEKVLESLTTGRNALLESPTGTARAATRRRRPLPPRHARRRHPRSPRSVGTRKQQGFLTARRGSRFEDRGSILAAKEPAADAKDSSFVPPSIAQAPARRSACCARRSGGARRSVKRRRTERTKRRRTRPAPRKRLRLRAPRPKSKSALERCAALATRTRVPLAVP